MATPKLIVFTDLDIYLEHRIAYVDNSGLVISEHKLELWDEVTLAALGLFAFSSQVAVKPYNSKLLTLSCITRVCGCSES